MKQYYLTSLYTKDMQIAVQQDHACKVLYRQFRLEEEQSIESKIFDEYIFEHETTICLGVSQPMEILKFYSYIQKHKDILQIPNAIFQERSLNKTATALTFVTTTKLSHPIMHEVRNVMKDNRINSFYKIKEPITLKNRNETMTISVKPDERQKPEFTITFERKVFKSAQNEELMPTELTPEVLDELYETLNEDDYNFHNGIEVEEVQDEFETVTETYSIEELVFLDMVSQLRLK